MVLRSGQSQEHQRKLWKSGSCLGASEAMSHSRGVLLARSFHQMLVQVCTISRAHGAEPWANRTAAGARHVVCVSTGPLLSLWRWRTFSRATLRDVIGPLLTIVLLLPLPIGRSAYPTRYSYAQTLCRFALHTAPPDVGGKAMCKSPVWQRLDGPFGCQKR